MNIDFIQKNKSIIKGGIVLIAVIFIILLIISPKADKNVDNQNEAQNNTSTNVGVEITTNNEISQPTTSGNANNKITNQVTNPQAPASSVIAKPQLSGSRVNLTMVTPAAGEIWATSTEYTIRWTRAEGHSGYIQLLNSATKAVVGWIASSIATEQNTVGWNTSRVLSTKTGPVPVEVKPGNYIIKVVFDSGTILQSAPFSIVPGVENLLVRNVSIQNGLLTPNILNIKSGEYIAVINSDSSQQTHSLSMNGNVVAKLSPRDTYVFNVSKYAPGNYEFRLTDSQLAKLTVTVSP